MCRSEIFAILLCAVLSTLTAQAQNVPLRDTIQAAVKTDTRRIELSLGRMHTGLDGIRAVISPLGEGDPIRWAQGLPGVSTGADGTTSMYVRGGGAGNNLFSLDGVPVYGYSHILGLTTIVPTEIIESGQLAKGGFGGDDGNFTASHLQITTKTPSEARRLSFSLNNFLASAGVEGCAGNKLSYVASFRISPLTFEYRALRGALPDILSGMDDFSASVGDVFGKLCWEMDFRNTLEAEYLGSWDRYDLHMPDFSKEMMGWHNQLGSLKFTHDGDNSTFSVRASLNHYGSEQEQDKFYRDVRNRLSLQSSLKEYMLDMSLSHLPSERLAFDEGLKVRFAQFAPGQVGERNTRTNVLLTTAWAQAKYTITDRLVLKGAVRCNYYKNLLEGGQSFDPDGSISAKLDLTRWLSLELTGDRMMQYYHTLEGLPVGWSLDMIVPSAGTVLPEDATQGNVGMTAKVKSHTLSLGGFYKTMDNLIYYKYAQSLFSGALASWEDQVDIGKGKSYGAEFLYEYQGKDFYGRIAYTLSKTTRYDFASFYDGGTFHARFDRRHVLNATAQWKDLSASFILQSGHWENGAAETYLLHPTGDPWTAEYYSGVNNYHMPMVIRLDLGYQFKFQTGKVDHSVNVGICNVTNHFNPFMLYFDTRTESWNEIAILPIMPNFSWRVTF